MASVCGWQAEEVKRRWERRLERRSATPLPSRRRKAAADAANLIVARDERSFCGAEQTWSRGKGATVKSVERRKMSAGHGEARILWNSTSACRLTIAAVAAIAAPPPPTRRVAHTC